MGNFNEENHSMRRDRSVVAVRESRRISVADTTARRLSMVGPGMDDAVKAAATDTAKAVALEEGQDEESVDE
jgi:hypothetical protein